MRKVNKRVGAVLGGTAVAVAGAGAAYAYWTTTGSGTGAAGTSHPATVGVTINQDTTASPLTGFVLGATKDVYVTATNDAAYKQNIGNITVTVEDVKDVNDNVVCAASNWTVTDVTDNIGTLAGSATSSSTKVATLTLNDTSSNQDGCQDVTPVLDFSAAQGA
jgi:hypothetical protein